MVGIYTVGAAVGALAMTGAWAALLRILPMPEKDKDKAGIIFGYFCAVGAGAIGGAAIAFGLSFL